MGKAEGEGGKGPRGTHLAHREGAGQATLAEALMRDMTTGVEEGVTEGGVQQGADGTDKTHRHE